MPDIDSLLEKTSKKKFKKSSYRPWNYLEEIQKEEEEKNQHEIIKKFPEANVKPAQDHISSPISNALVEPHGLNENISPIKNNQANSLTEKLTLVFDCEEKEKTSYLFTILRLSGHQKNIFNFILERCLSRESLSSGIVTSEMLISITSTSLSMVNTSIQRLVEKNLISRQRGKRGRGGFYCFGLNQEIKDAAVEYRRLALLDTNEMPKPENAENHELLKLDNRKNALLPKEWEEIDIAPLSHISFTRGHLVQLYKQENIDCQTVQDSIYHFSYDLEHNDKSASITKSNPIGYFMGTLKRAGLYNAPPNYESPTDKALRKRVEQKKLEKEKRDAMAKELMNIAFDDWQVNLTQEEKDKYLPEEIRSSRLTGAKISSLRAYFMEHIWPQLAPAEIREAHNGHGR